MPHFSTCSARPSNASSFNLAPRASSTANDGDNPPRYRRRTDARAAPAITEPRLPSRPDESAPGRRRPVPFRNEPLDYSPTKTSEQITRCAPATKRQHEVQPTAPRVEVESGWATTEVGRPQCAGRVQAKPRRLDRKRAVARARASAGFAFEQFGAVIAADVEALAFAFNPGCRTIGCADLRGRFLDIQRPGRVELEAARARRVGAQGPRGSKRRSSIGASKAVRSIRARGER